MDRVPKKKKQRMGRSRWNNHGDGNDNNNNNQQGTHRSNWGNEDDHRRHGGGPGRGWNNRNENRGRGGNYGGRGWSNNRNNNNGRGDRGSRQHGGRGNPPPWHGSNGPPGNRAVQPMPGAQNYYGPSDGTDSPLVPPAGGNDEITVEAAPLVNLTGMPTTEEWCDTPDIQWESLTHLEKIKYLTPRIDPCNRPDVGFFNQLPPEVLRNDLKKHERTDAATQAAVATVEAFFAGAEHEAKIEREEDSESNSESEDFGDDDYEDPYKRKFEFEWGGFLTKEFALKFVRGLREHLLFTASFDASGSDEAHDHLCHCPCSTKKSMQWLKLIGFDGIVESTEFKGRFSACNNRRGTYRHFALLAHLEQLRDDPLHRGILIYVKTLYQKYYGPLDHEALYKNFDDAKYHKVMAYKTRQLETKLADLRANERKYRERRDQLVDKDDDADNVRIKRNRVIFDGLDMTGKEPVKYLSRKTISNLSVAHKKFVKLVLMANGVNEDKEKNLQGIDSDDIKQPCNLNVIFDEWSRNTGPADKSCLFRELNATVKKKLLCDGSWNFAVAEHCSQDDKGVDEGGLTRMFFDACWNQMGSLVIDVNGTKVNLFTNEPCGISPQPHYILCHHIKRIFKITSDDELDGHDGAIHTLQKAGLLYRACGRIMCHALATNHVLPWGLLPGIYRGYLFSGRTPIEEDNYPAHDLFPHLKELDLTLGEDGLRETATELLITGRSHALDKIHEGLTLDSAVDFRLFFEGRQMQVVDEIMFASPDVTAEMIITNLECYITAEVRKYDSFDSLQKKFVEETLPEFLRMKEKSDPTYLRDFLKHVTGLCYINRRDPVIRISLENLNDDLALPVAHTCEQELSFPLTVYDASIESLGFYLGTAMEHSSLPGYGVSTQ